MTPPSVDEHTVSPVPVHWTSIRSLADKSYPEAYFFEQTGRNWFVNCVPPTAVTYGLAAG